jgi:hypothetical protein
MMDVVSREVTDNMRHVIVAIPVLALALTVADAQTQGGRSSVRKNGYVPDADTAIKVGEAVLIPVYGEQRILSERPFKAILQGDVWTVAGTLHCGPDPAHDDQCKGGTAEVKISKSSGRILHMIHYK